MGRGCNLQFPGARGSRMFKASAGPTVRPCLKKGFSSVPKSLHSMLKARVQSSAYTLCRHTDDRCSGGHSALTTPKPSLRKPAEWRFLPPKMFKTTPTGYLNNLLRKVRVVFWLLLPDSSLGREDHLRVVYSLNLDLLILNSAWFGLLQQRDLISGCRKLSKIWGLLYI